MKNVNLYIQTEYSMLNSNLAIERLVSESVELGYKALAITDINNMYGVISFYRTCNKYGVKPIIGLSLVIDDNRFLLYAKDDYGYYNLKNIATIVASNKDVDLPLFSDYFANLVCIIPGDENQLVRNIIDEKNNNLLNEYKKYFDDLYIGVDFQSRISKEYFKNIYDYANLNNIPMVPLHKSMYFEKDDIDVYQTLKCIEGNVKKYLLTEKETNCELIHANTFLDSFRAYPELINNLDIIESKCNVTIEFGVYHMPKYTRLDNKEVDSKKLLYDLSLNGLIKRAENSKLNNKQKEEYIERWKYELNVINNMGFTDYFLVVYDYINFARKSGIRVGQGRGSSAGSLVAYTLGITDIDPVKYGLLFERFLNPERVNMPDIDTDFQDDRREEVLKYLINRYGNSRVAQVITFDTFGIDSAISDYGRVNSIDEAVISEIKNNIDKPDIIKRMIDEDEVVQEVVKTAKKMLKLPRNRSVHASAVIIADKELDNYVPLIKRDDSLALTQYAASDVEELGLVKMDILAIKNLTMIEKIVSLIPDKTFNVNKIPLDDKLTYELIRSGDTYGIFQISSKGMTDTIIKLKCDKFEDIADSIALYRPGAMDSINDFALRKLGKKPVEYMHPDLEPILKSTYGTIVYQEQIIQIASKFSGFSLGQADILRRAISKKKEDLIISIKDKFIEGAKSKGHDEKVALEIFQLIMKFANYGFNKSHSYSYAWIVYQMSYLKAHYLKEFITVLLGYELGKNQVVKNYIMQAAKHNIKVAVPNINKSNVDFVCEGNTIYYSLSGITGIGVITSNQIVSEREKNGLYLDYDSFVERTSKFLSRSNVENLIHAGALDDFKIPRKALVLEYDKSLQIANYSKLFKSEMVKHEFLDDEYNFSDISLKEREALGFNLKYDLFSRYANTRAKNNAVYIANLKPGTFVTIMFAISRIYNFTNKKGEEMAFLDIYDESDTISAVMFSQVYSIAKNNLALGKLCLANVKVELRDEKLQVIINKIKVDK